MVSLRKLGGLFLPIKLPIGLYFCMLANGRQASIRSMKCLISLRAEPSRFSTFL